MGKPDFDGKYCLFWLHVKFCLHWVLFIQPLKFFFETMGIGVNKFPTDITKFPKPLCMNYTTFITVNFVKIFLNPGQ